MNIYPLKSETTLRFGFIPSTFAFDHIHFDCTHSYFRDQGCQMVPRGTILDKSGSRKNVWFQWFQSGSKGLFWYEGGQNLNFLIKTRYSEGSKLSFEPILIFSVESL